MAIDWQIGDRIQNRWQIYNILGGYKRSGMGIVYVIYDHELHEPFAAKTFQDEAFAHSPAVAERFKQEALTWINLDSHQNVTEARFVLTIASKPYLFLEYVSGGDLSEWISTPRLTEDLTQVLRFAIQFCDGMIYARSKGITAHRDIKPQNCLVTQDNTLKVTDFGLAKVFDDIGQVNLEIPDPQGLSIVLSRTGTAAGTCTHMAPEQFDDAKHVDVRADIYSFGVMLYQMVTGKLPFLGRSYSEFERLHKKQGVPPLDQQSSALSRIVERCLAKEPESRYGGFGEVRDGLAMIYEELIGEEAPQPVRGAVLDATKWGNKGLSLNELGLPEEALTCYNHALEITPRDEMLWSNKGKALDESGRPEEALACYDRALEISPRDEVAWNNKGNALVKLGQPDEALACYGHALEINPRSAKAWYNKGTILNELGRPEEALRCFDRALETDQRDEAAWYNKGVILAQLGRSQEALACFDRALEINPRYEKAWFNKGGALVELGQPEQAFVCFNRVLEINSRDERAWSNKGNTLDELGWSKEALACYDRALEINPRAVKVWMNKGNTLAGLGWLDEALGCYDQALEINSIFAEAWYLKGNMLTALGQPDEAIVCYDRAIEINPRFEEAWHNKGSVLNGPGWYEEALECFDRALEINPRYGSAWHNKGIMLGNSGQLYEALACFEEAQQLGYPGAAQSVAMCRQMLGQKL